MRAAGGDEISQGMMKIIQNSISEKERVFSFGIFDHEDTYSNSNIPIYMGACILRIFIDALFLGQDTILMNFVGINVSGSKERNDLCCICRWSAVRGRTVV